MNNNLAQLAKILKSDDVSESELTEVMIMAAISNNVAAINILLEHGADPNAIPVRGDYTDYSPLYAAASHGHIDATKVLIQAGARIDLAPPSHGMTPLAVAVDYEADTASQSGSTPVMMVSGILFEAGANPLLRDSRGVSALSLAQSYHYAEAMSTFAEARS